MNQFTTMVIVSQSPEWFIDTILLRQAEAPILFEVTWLCGPDYRVSQEVGEYSRRFMRALTDMLNGDWP